MSLNIREVSDLRSTASQGFAWSVLKLRFTKSSACFWSSRLRVVCLFLPRHTTLYFKLLHQSSNCTACNNITFTFQFLPDFTNAIPPRTFFPNSFNLFSMMQVMQISFRSMFPCEAMLLISGKLVSDKPGTVQLGLNPTIATLNSEESRRFLIAS